MKRLLRMLIFLLLALLLSTPALANSAEPPCFTVLVISPPEGLELSLRLADGTEIGPELLRRETRGWEAYYRFYYYSAPGGFRSTDGGAVLLCRAGGESFRCELPVESFRDYNNLLTLNWESRSLSLGQPGWRVPALVALRVVITLLLEGGVFLLFGYRTRRSWLVFFAVNLLTQTGLNALFAGPQNGGYLLLGFAVVEAGVFIAEMILFGCLLREHRRRRGVLCALTANAVSLAAGGLLIARLPI